MILITCFFGYSDPFHEVKSKKEKKKEVSQSRKLVFLWNIDQGVFFVSLVFSVGDLTF